MSAEQRSRWRSRSLARQKVMLEGWSFMSGEWRSRMGHSLAWQNLDVLRVLCQGSRSPGGGVAY